MTENRAVTGESIKDKVESQGASPVDIGAVNQAKYINAVLHSKLGSWFLINTGAIPVPKIPAAEQLPFIGLVDQILRTKAADPEADTSEFEEGIDWLVYDLYGLTNEETAEVADFFWDGPLSEEEEDRAFLKMVKEDGEGDYVGSDAVRETLRSFHGG